MSVDVGFCEVMIVWSIRKDYQNYSVLYSVLCLHTLISTHYEQFLMDALGPAGLGLVLAFCVSTRPS